MKTTKKLTALLLVIISIFSVFAGSISANAADGFEAGDTIYLDFGNMPLWFTTGITPGIAANDYCLYINFTNNTRYDSGIKETIVIGEDKERFDPRPVTEQVDEYVYKYVITDRDAGAKTLMFWRGSRTNLWNNSIELRYSDYAKGFNTVYVTDWNSTGYLDHTDHFGYKLDAVLNIKEDDDKGKYTITLACKEPVDDDKVTAYSYEIYLGDTLVSDTDTYSGVISEPYAKVIGVIKAMYEDGTVVAMATAKATIENGDKIFSAAKENMLYAHAVTGDTSDTEAWQGAQLKDSTYMFYLPCSADTAKVELYSTYDKNITVGNTVFAPHEVKTIEYEVNKDYSVSTATSSFKIRFMRSGAEAALYVNNDHSTTDDLYKYLTASKENFSSAKSAVVAPNGSIDNTDIKKIKGRGNTTWTPSKKPFNVNFKSAVRVGDMQATKKYSLLANFQDASLCRNRVLYDMGDAVGLRYSCDSRFIDFYIDGVYKGQYQMCQKIDAGKDNLVYDMDEDGYINEDGTLKEDFSFLIEVPFAEDFYTQTSTGIYNVIKSPDVEGNNNLYANEVKAYVRQKFEAMYKALTSNSKDLASYIDIDSFAKAYIIQELGKNWDTHSWYLVYMPDEEGNYKFIASPIWDFDNSIGNAKGVPSDIEKMRITDYTLPTGWWAKYKSGSNNMTYLCTQNPTIMEAAKTVWFKKFVPAIDIISQSGITDKEILSRDVYYSRAKDSAAMNYQVCDFVTDQGSTWIAKHTSLIKASFDYSTLTYSTDATPTSYTRYSYEDEYNYMIDWLISRAAWLSNEWKDHYTEGDEVPDAAELKVTEPDTPEPDLPSLPSNTISAFVFDSAGKVSGAKLEEYGDKSGYAATTGTGTLVCHLSDEGTRALEWSAVEYGKDGNEMVPLMSAGSKNPWGEKPYIDITLSTKDHKDIAISLTSAGSKKCPATWQLAYSTDGESFTDIDEAIYTISLDNRKIPLEYLNEFKLPSDAADRDTLILRLYAVSDETVSGGSVKDAPTGGELVINNIIITGDKLEDNTRPVNPSSPAIPTDSTEPVIGTKPGTTDVTDNTYATDPTSPSGSTPSGTGTTYLLGDADANGTVNVKDATLIQKYSAGIITKIDEEVADCNGDKAVNVKDATAIQKFSAALPVPYDIGKVMNRK